MSSGVAATAMSQSRLAAFLWRRAGVLQLGVVLKATFRMRHERRMEQIAPEPFLVGDESEPADDLIPFRQTADVWVVGWARKPVDAAESMLRLWVSGRDTPTIDRVVGIGREHWARAGGGGRLSLAHTPLGPVPHPSAFSTAEGIIDLPEGTDYERFQWARPEQRVQVLTGHEWVGVAGSVLEPEAVISQLPHLRATARLYDRTQPEVATEVPMAADLLAIDAGAWTCSVTWHGSVSITAEQGAGVSSLGDRESLHVVGGVTSDEADLVTTSPFSDLRGTARGVGGSKAPALPFAAPAVVRPPPPAAADLLRDGGWDQGGTFESVQEAIAAATPFEAAPLSESSRHHAAKLGTTMIEAVVRRPATPFHASRARPPSAPPPQAFTDHPPVSWRAKERGAEADGPRRAMPVGSETLRSKPLPAGPATPFEAVPPGAANALAAGAPSPVEAAAVDPTAVAHAAVGAAAPANVGFAAAEPVDPPGPLAEPAVELSDPSDSPTSVTLDTDDEPRDLRATLPFDAQPRRPEKVGAQEAPKSDLMVMPFRTPRQSLGEAFLAAFDALAS